MKRQIQIIALFCLSFLSVKTSAQQMVLSSQYMVNSFAINPAAAGTKTYAPLVLDVRRQWAGIREAPVAQHLSYHTNITSKLGVGGYLYNDVAGPSRRTGFMAALSTQVAISRGTHLSLGLAGSFSQYVLDREKLITEEPNDNTVDNFTSNLLIPDISGGLKFYAENYHLGFSLFNLLQTKTDLFDITTPVTNSLQRTMYLTGSYIIPINSKESLFLEPSAVGRFMFNAPFQFDLNLRLAHEMGIWGAVSYRFKDAIALIVGYTNDYFGVSYSYDINSSPLKSYNSGSHEITLTLKSKNKSGGGYGSSKFRVLNCPSF